MDGTKPEVMTIEEAAEFLRISKSSLYKLSQEGRIPCQKVGRHWRFHRSTLEKFVAGEEFLRRAATNVPHHDLG